MMLEERIVLQYAGDYVGSWKDMERFAKQQLAAETGLAADHFEKMAEDAVDKLHRLRAVLLGMQGTSKHRVVSQYFHILEASQFYQISGEPFPKPSLIQTAGPIVNAVKIGQFLLPLRGAIETNHHLETSHAIHGDSGDVAQLASWAIVRGNLKSLKEAFPTINPEHILLHLRRDEPLQPPIERNLRLSIEQTFGIKLPAFVTPAQTSDSKPH